MTTNIFGRRSPIFFVLPDRADGSLWMLNDNDEPGAHPVSIKPLDTAEMYKGGNTYVVGREIILQDQPAMRLIVRDGQLGYDYLGTQHAPDFEDPNPNTGRNGRRRRKHSHWYIRIPDGWVFPEALSAIEVTR